MIHHCINTQEINIVQGLTLGVVQLLKHGSVIMPQTTIDVSKGDILLALSVLKTSEINLIWSMS